MGLSPSRLPLVAALVAAVGLALVAAPAGAADPIVSTEPPAVTGAAVFGQRLTVSTGSWTPDGLTFSYSWARDGVTIDGKTGRHLRLGLPDLGHRITATVTATDSAGGSLAVTTDPTGRVRRADLTLVSEPRVTGVRRYTRTLVAGPGEWSATPRRVSYQWLRGGRPIDGATRSSYVLQAGDVGHRVRVEVTVRHRGYHPGVAASEATGRIRHRVPVRREVTYRVETRGRITADLATFRRQVQQTYDDPRGWRSAGVSFRRVARGGTFTVVLAEASKVPTFSSECSATWSCRVGRYVIINQTRWLHASPAWNRAHQSRRSYRSMVVNHETGHWLGHGHASCPGRGRLAPVMMQQSKGLNGCRFNPWPLPGELWYRSSARVLAAQVTAG